MQAAGPVEQRTRELREVLADKEAKPEEIKAKLTAFRAAKEQARQELVKARQDLRQLMTLRQEAVLVVNGLLD
jgi:Spy/CpxP family protein refolding chaperone